MPFATAVPLGHGGTGEVLKAWDEERGRYVALKLLHRTDPESLARLQREARAQARIDHPNICDVYDVSETEEGRPYIAMRYVDGLPLDQALRDEPLERRLEVIADVAETVQAAHAHSLIHRDLKPGNILVERDDEGRFHPFVLDFGLVRHEGLPGATATGEVLGTPGYLSPEQAAGQRDIDRRSDVFALGILIYELIAGVNPFLGASKVDSLVRAVDAAPPRLRSAAPQVPRSLEAIEGFVVASEGEERSAEGVVADAVGEVAGGLDEAAERVDLPRQAGRGVGEVVGRQELLEARLRFDLAGPAGELVGDGGAGVGAALADHPDRAGGERREQARRRHR
ncbi:MAG: serine/threonine-protein kinase, partial [Acidobacteriota bacterium]